MSIDNQVREITKEVIRLQDATNKAVVSMENALKELTRRIKVIEDSVTTIEECDISEWNEIARRQAKYKNYLEKEKADTHSWRTGAKIVKE